MNKIDLIKDQLLMEGLTEEELFVLSFLLKEETYPPKSVIIEENETSDDIYFIVEGEVELLKFDIAEQNWRLIDRLRTGNMFGEMAFLDSSPRSLRVEATDYTTVLKLSKADLDVMSIYHKIVKNIALISIDRLRSITEKYVNERYPAH